MYTLVLSMVVLTHAGWQSLPPTFKDTPSLEACRSAANTAIGQMKALHAEVGPKSRSDAAWENRTRVALDCIPQ